MRILAVVLAVLLLLLFSPVRVRFTLWEGEAALEVRFLFIRLRFPSQKPQKEKSRQEKLEKKRTRKKKPEKEKGAKKKREKAGLLSGPWDAQRLCGAAGILRDLLAALGRAGAFFLRGIRIKRLWLEIVVARGDPERTGAESGRLNAWACGALSVLQNFIRLKDVYLNIYPCFWAAEESVALDVVCWVTPARALGAACMLIGRGIRLLFRFLRLSRSDGLSPDTGPAEARAGTNPQQEGS